MEEEVFLDAKEEVTPRRSNRKRRSTAGSCTTPGTGKRPKMPTRHSPKSGAVGGGAAAGTAAGKPEKPTTAPGPDVTGTGDEFWTKMGGMLGALEARMKHETDQVKEQLGVAVNTIGDLGSRVDKAERRLDGIMDEVNMIMDKRLAALPAGAGGTDREEPGPSDTYAAAVLTGQARNAGMGGEAVAKALNLNPAMRKEESYWKCRQALRLRPIGQGNLTEAVKRFLVDDLGLDSCFVESVGHFDAQRVPSGPAAKFRGEAVVHFRSVEVRDAIKSAARNLAGKGSTYGIRLELPNHLKSAMRALQSVSFDLKSKYPQARRNVLFEDESMDLVLDFCLEEGGPWKRMSSNQAIQRKKRSPPSTRDKLTLNNSELDRMLDGSGEHDDSDTE